jgi:hypothetical protein
VPALDAAMLAIVGTGPTGKTDECFMVFPRFGGIAIGNFAYRPRKSPTRLFSATYGVRNVFQAVEHSCVPVQSTLLYIGTNRPNKLPTDGVWFLWLDPLCGPCSPA